MDDPRKNKRLRHGLIPLMVAMRVMAKHEEQEKKAAREAEQPKDDKPRRQRRWRWFS